MPFALLAIGILLVIAAYNNTQDVLAAQIKKDFSGKTGFIYWIAAIVLVGALGYIRPLQPVSRGFLALILVVLFLTNSGAFAKFNAALSGAASGDASAGADAGTAGGGGNVAGEKTPLTVTVKPSPGWSMTLQ